MSEEAKGSVQVFRIVRAPESPPITANDLRRLLLPFRRDTEMMVTEISFDAFAKKETEIADLKAEIKTLRNTIGLMELGEGSFTRALDKLTEEVNEKLSVLTKELEELKKERN